MGLASRVREWNHRTNRRYAEYHARTPTRRWLLRRLLPGFLISEAFAAVAGVVLHGDWTRFLFIGLIWIVTDLTVRALSVAERPVPPSAER